MKHVCLCIKTDQTAKYIFCLFCFMRTFNLQWYFLFIIYRVLENFVYDLQNIQEKYVFTF